jgi:pimeloyl-ACP methyl ester carboxylesterase
MLKHTLWAVFCALLLCATTLSHARTDDKTKPVLLIHGWSYFQAGWDCSTYFHDLKTELLAQGFTGPIITVGYYEGDINCDVNLRNVDATITDNTPWRALGRALNQYIQQTFTSTGQPVDVIAHSMGGLMTRAAVLGAQLGEDGFAPIMIEDAVLLGSPHKGTNIGLMCSKQCYSLRRDYPDYEWLNAVGHPQSLLQTDWSIQATTTDQFVALDSALNLAVDKAHRFIVTGPIHIGLVSFNACVRHAVQSLVTAAD